MGVSFCYFYGFAKLMGGPHLWEGLGANMGKIGVHFFPVVWGFMAALSESLGGVLLVLGIFTRTAAACLACTMIVAVIHHVTSGDGLAKASHAIEAGMVFLALVAAGSGKYAIRPS
ncbi:MAG: DoxX family protein [Candidatus Omnitrophica bacterium]|nr:DoxX family protein [Candidatus Omnitrophota bacterium]